MRWGGCLAVPQRRWEPLGPHNTTDWPYVQLYVPAHLGAHKVYSLSQNCGNGNHQLSFDYHPKITLLYYIYNYYIIQIIYKSSALNNAYDSDHNEVW